ncbi:M56 family metallopeptidase [Kitasatospora sp. A2-31]|uniref:M56 family metallopeptidase n=1 Tax=Kitasatospora sp. A2-31 TaxID=2916414 RepID=UPI001EEC7179|nr:M56 family metallopeptidase [Kitasatospora sp. A2-31]MCG6498304.1 M56 family metallopeptidase [Kitasatospora sp. A2-31]
MIGSLVLTGYAAVLGYAVPPLLARARWPLRAPRTAILLWQALMAAFVVTVALAWYHVTASGRHLHGLLGAAEQWLGEPHAAGGAEGLGLLVPVGLTALWPAAWFAAVTVSARRRRRRHARLLDLVGRPVPELGAVVLDHDRPAAYCLPGRPARVVLTSAAIDTLTPAQLQAVLAHERAHLTGRHHLAMAAAEAFGRAYRVLPLARAARERTAELIEMACDDRALRTSSARALADAMCEVATGATPQSAFAADGAAVLVRLKRLLRPGTPLHPAARCAVLLLGVAAAALPYFLTCGPVLG